MAAALDDDLDEEGEVLEDVALEDVRRSLASSVPSLDVMILVLITSSGVVKNPAMPPLRPPNSVDVVVLILCSSSVAVAVLAVVLAVVLTAVDTVKRG